ncbi:MAG: agmatinase [Clostridium sp.]|nr:agmatinase [Clostridium sp.]
MLGPFLSKNWIGSVDSYNEADIIMIGLPFDGTCSYRPGSRFAPERLRLASWGMEDYSPNYDMHLDDVNFFDAGELEFPLGNTVKTLDLIEENARHIFNDNKKYLGIGGEHLVTYPAVKACYEKYPDLAVIHFDAHTDLREDYLGEKLSHASVLRRIGETIGFENIKQIGIRSGLKEEFDLMKKYNTLVKKAGDLEPIKNKNIFLTIDIDVLDPSIMPGTGTPEADGMFYRELAEWIKYLKGFNIVGADVVELAPDYDKSEVSTAVAAKVIRDVLMIL